MTKSSLTYTEREREREREREKSRVPFIVNSVPSIYSLSLSLYPFLHSNKFPILLFTNLPELIYKEYIYIR